MKPYVVALAVGLLVGALYGALNVRSPAPPYVALLGLLGILLGEQVVAAVRQHYLPADVATVQPQKAAPDASE